VYLRCVLRAIAHLHHDGVYPDPMSWVSTPVADGKRVASTGTGICDPLFVLPVDDFDLNPARCLELLQLLRILSVPRLFALVLGNTDQAEMMLAFKIAGEFHRLAGLESRHAEGRMSARSIASSVDEIATHTLRKLLPPHQRIHLAPMTHKEALDFKPTPSDYTLAELLFATPIEVRTAAVRERGKRAIAGRTLDRLLGLLLARPLHTDAIQLKDSNTRIPTRDAFDQPPANPDESWSMIISRFLDGKAVSPIGLRMKNLESPLGDPNDWPKRHEDYSANEQLQGRFACDARRILVASPRDISDLWHGLSSVLDEVEPLRAMASTESDNQDGEFWQTRRYQVAEQHSAQAVMTFLARRFSDIVLESPEFPYFARKVLRDAFSQSPSGWTIQSEKLVSRCETEREVEIVASRYAHTEARLPRKIAVVIKTSEEEEFTIPSNSRLYSEFRLLHDVVALSSSSGEGRAGYIRSEPDTGLASDGARSGSSIRSPWPRWFETTWRRSDGRSVKVPFYHPINRSFLGMELLANTWHQTVPFIERSPHRNRFGASLYYWMAAITGLAVGVEGSAAGLFCYDGESAPTPNQEGLSWDSLLRRVGGGEKDVPEPSAWREIRRDYIALAEDERSIPWQEQHELEGSLRKNRNVSKKIVGKLREALEMRAGPPWPLLHVRIEGLLKELCQLHEEERRFNPITEAERDKSRKPNRHRREFLQQWLRCCMLNVAPERGVPDRLARNVFGRKNLKSIERYVGQHPEVLRAVARRRRLIERQFIERQSQESTGNSWTSNVAQSLSPLGLLLFRPDELNRQLQADLVAADNGSALSAASQERLAEIASELYSDPVIEDGRLVRLEEPCHLTHEARWEEILRGRLT